MVIKVGMNDTKDQNNFVTTREAASLLSVSLRTIQLWVESGVLKAWKTVGGHRRIPRTAIAKLLEQQHSIWKKNLISRH